MKNMFKIKNDPFNICKRLKSINKNYFLIYNANLQQYEVHKVQGYFSQFCFSCGKVLCATILKNVMQNNRRSNQDLIKYVEQHNKHLDNKKQEEITDIATYKLQEIYKYANGAKSFTDGFNTQWN